MCAVVIDCGEPPGLPPRVQVQARLCFKREVLVSPSKREVVVKREQPEDDGPPRAVVVKKERAEANTDKAEISPVTVKQELNKVKLEVPVKMEVPLRRLTGKQTADGVVKREIAVKHEPGSVKQEDVDIPESRHMTPKKWYRNQVAFLDQVVDPPWRLCWGALGTGIIAVKRCVPEEPRAASSAEAASSSTDKPSARNPGAASVKTEDADGLPADTQENQVPLDATICLLQTLAPQRRNAAVLGGYGASRFLNFDKKSLHWSSQRSDKEGKKMSIIVKHHKAGGRVVVGVRCGSAFPFQMLGQVSSISKIQKGRFMVEEGDMVINESGSNIMHKAINANCLSDGLQRGVGLNAVRYPFAQKDRSVKWCGACCYKTPTCELHFEELQASGKMVFGKGKPLRRRFAKKETKKEEEAQPSGQTKKRGRPFGSAKRHPAKRVKTERLDPEAAEPAASGDEPAADEE